MEQSFSDNINLIRKAKILFASGELEASICYFTLAEELTKDKNDIWLSRGAALMALGRFSEAKEEFTLVYKTLAEAIAITHFRPFFLAA